TLTVDGAPVNDVLVGGDCGAPDRAIEGDLAFAGYGQPAEIRDVRGKIAMVLAGAPPSLPSTQRALASANEDKLKRLRAAGAVAEIVLTTQEVEARRPWALLQRNFVNGQAHVTDDLPPLPVAYVDLAESDRLRQRVGSRARLHLKQTSRAFDSGNVAGLLRGAELSTLEDHVRAAAAELSIAIVADPVPEQNFFARSDQLNFARIGVPSACLWQGFSGARGEAAFKDFRANRYHQPSDEWLP